MVWYGMGVYYEGKKGCSDVDVIAVEESITRWPAPHRSFWCGIQRVKEPREALEDGGERRLGFQAAGCNEMEAEL